MDIPSEEFSRKVRIPMRIATGAMVVWGLYLAYQREPSQRLGIYLTLIAMAGLFVMTFLKWKEPAGGFPPGEFWRRLRLIICITAGVLGVNFVYLAYQRGVPAFYLGAVVMALVFAATLRKWRK